MFRLLFLVSSVFIVVGFAGGNTFPRTPISYSVPGFHFLWVAPLPPAAEGLVLTCPPAVANSSPASAAAEPCSPFPSAMLRLPYFLAGRHSCFVSHTHYYAQAVHLNRITSRYRNHCNPRIHAVAGASAGTRQSAKYQMPEQPRSVAEGAAVLRPGQPGSHGVHRSTERLDSILDVDAAKSDKTAAEQHELSVPVQSEFQNLQ